jgi:glucuronate isomerase
MRVYEAGDLRKAVSEVFRMAKEAGAVAASASFSPQVDFEEGSRDAADRILSLVLLGQKTGRDDRKTLRSYVMDLVLRACAEHEMPLQLMLGVRRPMPGDAAISAYDPAMVAGYAELFARHPGVKFDITTSNETLAHELAVLARNYRNVFVSGYWWYLMFPSSIRKLIRERVEMLPMTKSCGFFSDAYCVEWVYGKSRLARREMAFALASLVNDGYLSQSDASAVARHYLLENPKALYGL